MAPFYRTHWLYLRGQALCGQGHKVEARELLDRAREESERHGSRFHLWQVLALLAELDPAAARVYQGQASDIIEYIAVHSPASLREAFLEQPEVKKAIGR